MLLLTILQKHKKLGQHKLRKNLQELNIKLVKNIVLSVTLESKFSLYSIISIQFIKQESLFI